MSRNTAIGWVLAVLLAACYLWRQALPLLGDGGTGIAGIVSHQNDFKHIYIGTRLLAEGLSPYDAQNIFAMAEQFRAEDPRFGGVLPYVYLPFTGIVLRPFAALPFAKAAVAFMLLNHALLIAGLALGALAGGMRRGPWPLVLALALCAFDAAVMRQNNAGQLNAVLVFSVAATAFGIARGWHPAAVGFAAAFGAMFKLTPGILLLWFLLRRDWQRAAWMAGWCAAMLLVCIGIAGWRVHVDFLPLLRSMGYGKSTWAEFGQAFWRDPYNQSFNAFWHRLVVERTGSGITPWINGSAALANGLTWLCSLAVLASVAWRGWKPSAGSARELALPLMASLLVPSILWDHYLVQALLAIALLWAGCGVRGKALLAASAAIISLPVALDAEVFRSGFGLLGMSMKLIPALAIFAVALIEVRTEEPTE